MEMVESEKMREGVYGSASKGKLALKYPFHDLNRHSGNFLLIRSSFDVDTLPLGRELVRSSFDVGWARFQIRQNNVRKHHYPVFISFF